MLAPFFVFLVLCFFFRVGLQSFFIVSPVHDTPVIRLYWFLFCSASRLCWRLVKPFSFYSYHYRARQITLSAWGENARREAVHMLGICFCLGFTLGWNMGFPVGFKAGFYCHKHKAFGNYFRRSGKGWDF